jgi:phosphoglycerate dehydrogenase-like enzyme
MSAVSLAASSAAETPARPRIFVGPGAAPVVHEAIASAGGDLTAEHTEADALVWWDKDVAALQRALHPDIRWVQLPDAGVERWLDAGVITGDRQWTSARGCYGFQVAEHALALLLAAARRLPECGRLTSWPTAAEPAERPTGRSLRDAVVAVIGAGDIGTSLVDLLAPLGPEIVAVSRSGRDVPGATQCLPAGELSHVLERADHVVLAAPSTPQTRHLIGATELATMKPTSWLVNVGRGDLVDTDALVAAVRSGEIAGAALDVTEPEPLPSEHPLWSLDQVLITPHVANPPHLKTASFAQRVQDNVERYRAGRPLLGVVDPTSGY